MFSVNDIESENNIDYTINMVLSVVFAKGYSNYYYCYIM